MLVEASSRVRLCRVSFGLWDTKGKGVGHLQIDFLLQIESIVMVEKGEIK